MIEARSALFRRGLRLGLASAVMAGVSSLPGCGPDVGPTVAPGAGAGVRPKDTVPASTKTKTDKVAKDGTIKSRRKGSE